jgi:hypothetical protein
MADPYLVALAKAVENGTDSPPLWLTLHSGDLVTGTPAPSRAFIDGTFRALMKRYEDSKEARMAKKEGAAGTGGVCG